MRIDSPRGDAGRREISDVIDAATRPLRTLLLRLPTWAAVVLVSGTSVGLTVGLVLAIHVLGPGYGEGLRRALTIAATMPLIVSAPVAFVIVGLLRALEREHAKALALSQRDDLTGLLNRRTLHSIASRDIDIARRSAHALAVALLDLDDFKAVNDRHGHAVGDALLRAVADACVAEVRGSDVVARWGGEELVLVLPGTEAFGALDLMERVRLRVAATRVTAPDGASVGCTASIGVASLGPGDQPAGAIEAFERLVDLADQAMYEAKRTGKDRVRVAPDGAGGTDGPAWPPGPRALAA